MVMKRHPCARVAVLSLALGTFSPQAAVAVTCAQDSVPAATLLLPYFRVSRNGSTGGDIPVGGVDTICSITNASSTGIVVQAQVFSKYGTPVLNFNIPMNAWDSFRLSMRDVLNGRLNANSNIQVPGTNPDPCGVNVSNGAYSPVTGFAATRYIRFANPDTIDRSTSISVYAVPAYSGTFRQNVWDSLDESGDVTNLTSYSQTFVLDSDNRCAAGAVDGVYSGSFSGYVTFDVLNYCSRYFRNQASLYTQDALATTGWAASGYTPNVLLGDYTYLDPDLDTGVSASMPLASLEFDNRLDWSSSRTFSAVHNALEATAGAVAPAAFRFRGDGREALGNRYGIRFVTDAGLLPTAATWLTIWRADFVTNPGVSVDTNVCAWWSSCRSGGSCLGGYQDITHVLDVQVYDPDGNQVVLSLSSGPSVFLATQRLVFPTAELNPTGLTAGFVDMLVKGSSLHQAHVAVQTSSRPGVRNGFGAILLDQQFQCSSTIFGAAGNVP